MLISNSLLILKNPVNCILKIAVICLVCSSCKKTVTIDLPEVVTSPVSEIGSSSVISGGFIVSDGNSQITKRGVCWSLVPYPTIFDSTTNDAAGTGSYESKIKNLKPNTTYFLRAYAINAKGVSYGLQQTFTTKDVKVGEKFQGGIVGYVLQLGDPGYIEGETHGLIVSEKDISLDGVNRTAATWGCVGKNILTSGGTRIGAGKQNTVDIVNGCNESETAARLCYNLVEGGFSDWYLPSSEELQKILINRTLCNFIVIEHWTSTQYDSNLAYLVDVDAIAISNKNSKCYVRAIRYF